MKKPASPEIAEINIAEEELTTLKELQQPFWDETVKDLTDIIPKVPQCQITDNLLDTGKNLPTCNSTDFLDEYDQEHYSNSPALKTTSMQSHERERTISENCTRTHIKEKLLSGEQVLPGMKRSYSDSVTDSGPSKDIKLPRKAMLRTKEGDTLLHQLIFDRHEYANTYIEEDCDIRELNAVNHQGQTPLHIAVYLGSISTIKKILEKRLVDLERYDSDLNTPLHLACMKTNKEEALEISTILLTKCTSTSIVNSKNEEGMAPLHLAAVRNDLELIKLLRLKGADIDSQDDKTGKTCLMYLAENDMEGKTLSHVVEYFDADVDKFSYCDSTALHFACGKNNSNAARILLENGVKVGIKNVQKKSEKELASDIEIKKMLEKESRRQKRLQSIESRRKTKSTEEDLISENESETENYGD
ncbi:NF-kappa-B inhibitor alpha-like [Clytia hemisphaerica]|uniref:Uncharacterized protein n=1 Tax=Clytia hemisphaerica TaxID=252671 RepID=A0A7M5URU9_9CNID